MSPELRGALSRLTTRVVGSRFAKPVARVVLAAAGLLLLAFIGKTAVAGALAASPAPPTRQDPAVASVAAGPPPAPAVLQAPAPADSSAPPAPAAHAQATADDPVVLNTAGVDDLRRLPGVGEKRAALILAVRARLGGRFHAIEDLLKVKGIGRTTLRRLRPLVRLDPPPGPSPEAGAGPPG